MEESVETTDVLKMEEGVEENDDGNDDEDERMKDIIINLIVLEKIGTGMKLDVRDKIFVIEGYNWYQGLYRLYRRDDRYETLTKVTKLVNDVKNIDRSRRITYIVPNTKFKEYITGAIKGLKNLKITYKHDITFCAKLQVEIQILENIVSSENWNSY